MYDSIQQVQFRGENKTKNMGGVLIKNCTTVPLKIQLCQAGVLYHGLVQPGEYFARKTGAVHFTIRATVSDRDDTDWRHTVLPVVGVVVGSFAVLATAGAGLAFAGAGVGVAAAGAAAAGGTIGVEGIVTGAAAITGAGLLTAGGVLMTKELAQKLLLEAKLSHGYISSAGWYFGGKNELEIHGGPLIEADSDGFRYSGSPLYIVDKNDESRHS